MRYDIDKLLDKYWNGESSLQDEKDLRAYFLSDSVDEEYQDLIPLFSYFEAEAELGSDRKSVV